MTIDMEHVQKRVFNQFEVVEVVQHKPYTFVKIRVDHKFYTPIDYNEDPPTAERIDISVEGCGFAKVCFPDRWNPHHGVIVAGIHAIENATENLAVELEKLGEKDRVLYTEEGTLAGIRK